MIWRGKLLETGGAVEIITESASGTITGIRSLDSDSDSDLSSLPWISAGWIDLQVNGFGGYDLNGTITSLEDVDGLTWALHEKGGVAY